MVLGLDFAPLLLGVPSDPWPCFLTSALLGGLLALGRTPPPWPLVCAGVALLSTARALSIPSEVLALAKVPSLPHSETIAMQAMAGAELLLQQGALPPTVSAVWYTLLAGRYLGASPDAYEFGLRLVALWARVVLGRGDSLLVCASVLSSIGLEGKPIERALWLLGAWIVARVLDQWLAAALALVTVAQLVLA